MGKSKSRVNKRSKKEVRSILNKVREDKGTWDSAIKKIDIKKKGKR